jgi:D-glycero-D-manno-heptose 1,7-bisphosphate phosphatase
VTRPALFLDRDGTLIDDVGYPKDPLLVHVIDGAAEALAELQRDFALVVISNQSGIARGLVTSAQAKAVHDRFVRLFADAGVTFAGVYYCPHAPDDGCRCRKPAPGLLLDAARELDLDLTRSIMIGDKTSDLEAGRAAGCARVVRFGPEVDVAEATARCDDWEAVARCVTKR